MAAILCIAGSAAFLLPAGQNLHPAWQEQAQATAHPTSEHDIQPAVQPFTQPTANLILTPSPVPTPQPSAPGVEQLVPYNGPVEHIFFHPLIVYPELAFDGDSMSKGYHDWFVTIKEFRGILDSLYSKNYMLIDIHTLYEASTEDNHTVVKPKELRLPPGKKPVVLSIDDLNYYTYMKENGNAYRLVLDDDGEVATYSVTPDGKELVSRDNEIIPILDDFIEKHPDFSFQRAKGVIALTGYEGVLGYRTDQLYSADYAREKEKAMAVIERLKATGWSFASHGYGHLDAAKVSLDRFKKDTERWKKEVESLTGPTSVYIYPYGSSLPAKDAKYQFLLQSGFQMICAVGPAPYLQFTGNSVMMDRRHIDGIGLHDQRIRLLPLFDSKDIWDDVRG
ncbi:polysaccharide deacetylase family protein [Paenibacillus sp. WST5]|uniref:Polysaccharide deacetylase family protein n=2 Tax=Paenibacillus sedimenti TaxID=2770274 RepID=A0A926KNQ8_9BACL|nr:polysaccharide deacetylase family protein [Paenibacillus sedimenti]